MKQVFMLLFLGFFSGVAMAIEEPEFAIETKKENYEVRSYGPVLVAETRVDAGFEDAGNRAFRILADYIFGNNRAKTKIEMTAPVAMAKSEKIEMTAPVSMSAEGAGYVVQFTMPKIFNMSTIPEPNDARVQLREIPARKVAVFSYSGSWSKARYEQKLQEFKQALARDGVTTSGEAVFARFDSPFLLWFLRRNEIWLEISG